MHIIETSTPSVPEGFTVAYHKDMGPFDIDQLEQWLEENSASSKLPWPEPEICADVREWAEHSSGVINGCILDHILTHPELMPSQWKNFLDLAIAFGTIYADDDDALFVKALQYQGEQSGLDGYIAPICGPRWMTEGFLSPGTHYGFQPCLHRIRVGHKLSSGWDAKYEKPICREFPWRGGGTM